MLSLDDAWAWDSWVADDGERYHLFFLTAPRAIGDPDQRHTRARIGHAVSEDLRDWRLLPDALGPSESGWDDLALWTGSCIRSPDGTWRLFYTALGRRGHGVRDQRIGVARSSDLSTWQRASARPLVEPDGRWYATLPEDPTASETWRDPFVFQDPASERWSMLITARVRGGARNDDGVLGLAVSSDLGRWQVQPPISRPAGFGQLEVPQIQRIGDAWLLVFTCHPDEQSDERVARWGRFSTWSLTVADPHGPFDLDSAIPFRADPSLFAAPLVRTRAGGWVLLGFQNVDDRAALSLTIVDPIPVEIARDGSLQASAPALR